MRVHELAKKVGLDSKTLIEKLKKLNIDVKNHMSSLENDVVEKVVSQLESKKQEPVKKSKSEVETKKAVAKETPAIKKSPQPGTVVSKVDDKKLESKVKPKLAKKVEPKVSSKIVKAPVEKKVVVEKKQEPIKQNYVKQEPPKQEPVKQELPRKEIKKVSVKFPIVLKDLAEIVGVSPSSIIKKLMDIGIMVTINQQIGEQTGVKLLTDMGCEVDVAPTKEQELLKVHSGKQKPEDLRPRAPVVTFMGHVDHGKTSLLDYIRKTKVTEDESGGITQHIGAYEVTLTSGKVTFLDTPGHEAFTAMRARGANITDVVVLVVAADDGMMPQTIEAVDHARAAEVPLIVALNKIDKPGVNIDRVKKQLAEHNLTPEDWGGKTICVGVSAKTGQGVETLLDMLILEAEMLELKANPNGPASGVIVEAKLSKGSGTIATVLVQQGCLKQGDFIVTGCNYGRIRAMMNDKGKRIDSAGPSTPVELLGLSSVPIAGDKFFVVEDEKKARQIITEKQEHEKEKNVVESKKLTLEDLYLQIKEGSVKELKIILKTDVQGSIEAIRDSLMNMSGAQVKLNVIHTGIGDITDADVMLASASNAIIIGFHVSPTAQAAVKAKEEKVDIRLYEIIYNITADVYAAMEGLLEPFEEEVFVGRARVLQVFKLSKFGTISGCRVLKGKIVRTGVVKVIRGTEEIFKGKISSLKRFKDDVKDVAEGFECGIGIFNFSDFSEDDIIETYQIEKKARRLKN